MKKISSLILFGLVLLISYSCEENLNPFGEFKEKYVLNCIIRGDTTFQTATLTKSYQIENLDPFSNTNDPSVKGATIRIWNKDNVAILRDTTVRRPEGDPYKTPYAAYYTNSFQPDQDSQIEIEALLPNGKRLVSSTKVPAVVSISGPSSDQTIPPKSKNFVKVAWLSAQKNPVFITRLAIYYFKYESGQKFRNITVVPLNYRKFDNKWVPNYPKPTSESGYAVGMDVIDKTMELISDGDNDKSRYEILSCILEVLSLDSNLSTYYNATARSRDIYSVKLDETDYTEVTQKT